ncbi:MAG: cytochrome c oxidase subunit II [Halosimplex sp.]
MDRRRAMTGGFLALAALAVAPAPAAAQSVTRRLVDELNVQLVYVALPLALLVEVILVTAVVRFRDNDDPQPTAPDPALEVTWTVATGVILLFVGFSAYTVLGNPYIAASPSVERVGAQPTDLPDDAVVVDVVAYQWGRELRYPSANVTAQSLLVVPNGTDAYFRLTSADVVHSLFVPAFGVKQDAFPGQTTSARTRPTERGRFRLYCTEFCGEGHSRMRGTVAVVTPDRYRAWLDAHRGESNVTTPPNVTASPPDGPAAVESPAVAPT